MSSSKLILKKAQQRAISRAFDGACHELGIGMLGRDVWRRERLAQLILRLVNDEDKLDSAALQKRAVVEFNSGAPEDSSSTTASGGKEMDG